ncbi:702_t:CDS:2, partial [Funneliformis geosporum]
NSNYGSWTFPLKKMRINSHQYKISANIEDELGYIELTSISKISKHFTSQSASEHHQLYTIVERSVETKEIHCTRAKVVEVLHKTLEALKDDSEFGNLVRRF